MNTKLIEKGTAKSMIANIKFAVDLLEKQVESGELPCPEGEYFDKLQDLEALAACCNKPGQKQYAFSMLSWLHLNINTINKDQ